MTEQRMVVPVEKDTNFFSISCEKFVVGVSSADIQLTFCDDFAETTTMTLVAPNADGSQIAGGAANGVLFDSNPVRIQYGRIKMSTEAARLMASTIQSALDALDKSRGD